MEEKQIEFKLEEKEKKGNNKVVYILVASVFIILSLAVAYNIGKNSLLPKYEDLDKKYKNSEISVSTLEDDLSKTNEKLTQAEPWFELSSERQNEIKEELKKAEEERIAKEEADRKAKEEEKARKKQEEENAQNAKVTNLFNKIYMSYYDGVGLIHYESIRQSLSAHGFKYDVVEPTYDDVGKITIYDSSSSDSVVLAFYPIDSGEELLSLIQYNRSGKAVAVSNDYHTKSSRYSVYDGTNKGAYGVNQQKEFLFF